MTTHMKKLWWDLYKQKLVEQAIPEAEIYKREWVGLTDEEVRNCYFGSRADFMDYARAIETKLREKNT